MDHCRSSCEFVSQVSYYLGCNDCVFRNKYSAQQKMFGIYFSFDLLFVFQNILFIASCHGYHFNISFHVILRIMKTQKRGRLKIHVKFRLFHVIIMSLNYLLWMFHVMSGISNSQCLEYDSIVDLVLNEQKGFKVFLQT